MNSLLLAGVATFSMVFLRGFQQKNVHGNHYISAAVTSAAMCVADITVVLFAVQKGWVVLPYTVTGGVIGIVGSMWIHDKLTTWFKQRKVKVQGHSKHLGVLVQTSSSCMECGKTRKDCECDRW